MLLFLILVVKGNPKNVSACVCLLVFMLSKNVLLSVGSFLFLYYHYSIEKENTCF